MAGIGSLTHVAHSRVEEVIVDGAAVRLWLRQETVNGCRVADVERVADGEVVGYVYTAADRDSGVWDAGTGNGVSSAHMSRDAAIADLLREDR